MIRVDAVNGSGERRQYKNPPLIETLVDFRLASGQEWDPTIPGKLHEKVKADYPGKPRQQKLLQMSVQVAQGAPSFASREGIGRVQLVDADAQRLISLGPGVLGVHVLPPYRGWTEFKPRIDVALKAYLEVTGSVDVNRIGLRCINRVVIPSKSIDLWQYFLCGPREPAGLPDQIGSLLNRVEYTYDDGVTLVLTFASIEGGPDFLAFLLDLDLVWSSADSLAVDAALEKVDMLHERAGTAFEALITDKTREVFDAS